MTTVRHVLDEFLESALGDCMQSPSPDAPSRLKLMT